jgi:hypothetical protein
MSQRIRPEELINVVRRHGAVTVDELALITASLPGSKLRTRLGGRSPAIASLDVERW